MCPPSDIGVYWTEEELFMSLHKINRGSPPPSNVIPDLNPYRFKPSNLPEDVWFLTGLEEKKDTEHGFWKEKGEASDIYTNSDITGWRTTLEYYEGQSPRGRRTDWVMQEYSVTQKGLCDNRTPKDCRSLCRVFLSDRKSPDREMPSKHGGSILSNVPTADVSAGQGSTSVSLEKNRGDSKGPLAMAGRLEDYPVENLPEIDYVLQGDFLELDDLADDPNSPSSSSDNSSCLSMTSEECFDSLALLQDLEQQGKDATFKYTMSASVKPKEVVMSPATLGSLIGGNGSNLSAEGTHKSEYCPPSSVIEGESVDKKALKQGSKRQQANEQGTSTASHKSVSECEKKALVGQMKKIKKYCCFMPF